jgi:hypothetical protein
MDKKRMIIVAVILAAVVAVVVYFSTKKADASTSTPANAVMKAEQSAAKADAALKTAQAATENFGIGASSVAAALAGLNAGSLEGVANIIAATSPSEVDVATAGNKASTAEQNTAAEYNQLTNRFKRVLDADKVALAAATTAAQSAVSAFVDQSQIVASANSDMKAIITKSGGVQPTPSGAQIPQSSIDILVQTVPLSGGLTSHDGEIAIGKGRLYVKMEGYMSGLMWETKTSVLWTWNGNKWPEYKQTLNNDVLRCQIAAISACGSANDTLNKYLSDVEDARLLNLIASQESQLMNLAYSTRTALAALNTKLSSASTALKRAVPEINLNTNLSTAISTGNVPSVFNQTPIMINGMVILT